MLKKHTSSILFVVLNTSIRNFLNTYLRPKFNGNVDNPLWKYLNYAKAFLSFTSYRASVPTVCRLLNTIPFAPLYKLPEAVSIDEFKGNTYTAKYQCIFVDLQKHRILAILLDHTQSHLADYWRCIPRIERLKAMFFICDMWFPYAELTRTFFPNANIIIDKYHFIRQVTRAIENLR